MPLRSCKNNRKSLTLKSLDHRSSKKHSQATHSRKLSKDESYKQSGIVFTVNSPSNIKEPIIKNFIEIDREPRIKSFTEIKREPRIKNFIHIKDPNVIHENTRKNLFKGSRRENNKEEGSNSESEKREIHLRYRREEEKVKKQLQDYDLRSKEKAADK